MAFSSVPNESRAQIDKAGEVLARGNPPVAQMEEALDLAGRWRACHAYPINTFQATLRGKLKDFTHDPIAAQRLKRMPTIIDKLRRYPSMRLTSMQDIGGVRAILSSMREVNKLADGYRKSRRLAHELLSEKDYIEVPRNEDGYRSLHLIYRYKNLMAPNYDGLRLELQIRTKLQHAWATAVETMGTFLGQALKSRQGDREWIDFFAIISSAFARREKCAPIPRFSHLSEPETCQAAYEAEKALGALEKMQGFSVAVNEIVKKRGLDQSYFYHLIVLNSLAHSVQITAYGRDNLEQAVAAYAKAESEAAKGEKIEPVLVSAGPIDKLRRAYPNFFLDISGFASLVGEVIANRASHKYRA